MLFFYFLAALSHATGWMLVWALLGMVFSSRPSRFFILPALAAILHDPKLGIVIVVVTWVYLAWRGMNAAADRAEDRRRNEALIEQARQSTENIMHQPGKPGV